MNFGPCVDCGITLELSPMCPDGRCEWCHQFYIQNEEEDASVFERFDAVAFFADVREEEDGGVRWGMTW